MGRGFQTVEQPGGQTVLSSCSCKEASSPTGLPASPRGEFYHSKWGGVPLKALRGRGHEKGDTHWCRAAGSRKGGMERCEIGGS